MLEQGLLDKFDWELLLTGEAKEALAHSCGALVEKA